ncbi:recombinase family protein, partial [Staphylococcus equorum]
MIVGYARVSTIDQNLDRQIENLEAFGAERIFTEKQSGKSIENRL